MPLQRLDSSLGTWSLERMSIWDLESRKFEGFVGESSGGWVEWVKPARAGGGGHDFFGYLNL